MGKKQISYIILTLLVTFVIGLVLGQFLTIPAFRAFDDPPLGSGYLKIIALGPIDPETGNAFETIIEPQYVSSKAFICPSGMEPNTAVKFPFHLEHKVSKLRSRVMPGSIDREDIQLDDEDNWYAIAGNNFYYKTVTSKDGLTIMAKDDYEEVVTASNAAVRYYRLAQRPELVPYSLDLLAAKLEVGRKVKGKPFSQLLCTKLQGGGGTGGG